MKLLATTLSGIMLLAVTTSQAADPAPVVVSITADSVSEVVMPEALMQRLFPQSGTTDADDAVRTPRTHQAGYRVQVFSDNNARTAKNEARRKEQTVASRFPQYRTYKKYSAPYWRLRVGDFKTQREAESAASELRHAFPGFSKEIRVVRDRINISE